MPAGPAAAGHFERSGQRGPGGGGQLQGRRKARSHHFGACLRFLILRCCLHPQGIAPFKLSEQACMFCCNGSLETAASKQLFVIEVLETDLYSSFNP